jgi:transposase-like protein
MVPQPAHAGEFKMSLDEIVRDGARRMLTTVLEAEVTDFVARHGSVVDNAGRRVVVRNGYLPEREVLTGAGPLPVAVPRVRDKRGTEEGVKFTSAILPPYLRRSKTLDELIPWLYLRGVSTGQMQDALTALLGEDAPALSANVVTRLTAHWHEELAAWQKRDLSKEEFVYLWADGIYNNIRLEEDRQCVLVLIGATKDGRKELVAVQDGFRESKQDWLALLTDLKRRGMTVSPKVATGDGALGFWSALDEVFPTTRQQRCWVHKIANVMAKLPRHSHGAARKALEAIWNAGTRKEAEKSVIAFAAAFKAKHPAAVECVLKDQDELLAFYEFPAEHWTHLRTTNPIESTFATVRLRHDKTKGNGTRAASLVMVFKLVQLAARGWRKLNGHDQLIQLVAGRRFADGVLQDAA